jgi:DNA processing protein
MQNPLRYQLAISMIPGIGGITAKKLISYCGGAEAVFSEKTSALKKIPGIGDGIARAVSKHQMFERADQEIEFMARHDIRALYFTDKEYPFRLKHCEDGPILLFVMGGVDLNQSKVISVVGTRNMTDYGRKKCAEIIEGLKPHQAIIVSGLAYGVDAMAHKTAMECGLHTVAVLGHGLDRIYPPMHANLARKITRQGGLLSDFISGTNPDRENFPKRNRIIAGLCDAVVIIEAAVTGGALITATIANTYNRDVFAFPGRTSDAYSMGCNRLIKTHKANLIESVADLEYVMNWQASQNKKEIQRPLFTELDQEEKKLVSILREFPVSGIDLLASKTGLSVGKTSALLLGLEFKNVVVQQPGKCFTLNHAYQASL